MHKGSQQGDAMFSKAFLFIKSKLGKLKLEVKHVSTSGIPMRIRLFMFLIVLVLTMLLGVVAILLVTGSFNVGRNEDSKSMHRELSHLSSDISKQLGNLSVYAVDLSRGLSESIEKNLQKRGLQVTDLQSHPEILEDIIENEYERLLFSLQKAKSSGVFIVLDATVNPNLENAANSRAGLYIKNMEPNIISSSTPTIHVLYGFPQIARKNLLPLHSQWTMEMDTREAEYYKGPLEQAKRYRLPLSRLYYWSPSLTLPGTSEKVILCSIPLLDSNGNVFGVCGFEVSAMLFKLANMPDNSNYSRIFCMLSPINDTVLNTSEALFAGGYLALDSGLPGQSLRISKGSKYLDTYQWEEKVAFIGIHEEVQLYPKGSAFENQKWAVAVMLPQKDMVSTFTYAKLQLTFLCLILFIVGVVLSSFISRRYLKPITEGLDIIKSKDFSSAPVTKIPEIDDLIQFLSVHNEEPLPKPETGLSEVVFEEFVKKPRPFHQRNGLFLIFISKGIRRKKSRKSFA